MSQSLNFDMSSTYAKDAPVITLEKLKEIYEELSKTKRIVILFTPFLEDRILYGGWINEMLSCEKEEEGFLVPEKYRESLAQYQDAYREWRWKPPRGWNYGTFRRKTMD